MNSLFSSTLNTRFLPTGDERYLRSDCPETLTDDELAWLRNRRLTTAVDLREEKEYTRRVCPLENESGFTYYHLPVTGGGDPPRSPEDVRKTYLAMLDGQMEKIVDTILGAESGVLFFCGAGKDRTGVVSAVLLRRLGYSDDVIVADYMETKDNLMDFLMSYAKAHPEVNPDVIIPHEENIRAVLKSL